MCIAYFYNSVIDATCTPIYVRMVLLKGYVAMLITRYSHRTRTCTPLEPYMHSVQVLNLIHSYA